MKKISCPNCGKHKCFTRYVDTEGRYTFPDMVGICDHLNNCGYHYSPKEFFADHPEAKTGLFAQDQIFQPRKVITPPIIV